MPYFSDTEMSILYVLMFLPLYILVVIRGLRRSPYRVTGEELRAVSPLTPVIFHSGLEATVVKKEGDSFLITYYTSRGILNSKWMEASEFWSAVRFFKNQQVVLPD